MALPSNYRQIAIMGSATGSNSPRMFPISLNLCVYHSIKKYLKMSD